MRRLAIIGAGSSGLVTLKTALDHLDDWQIDCFEKSNSTQGCWGNPHEDFISTSTKYTTQFSCFQQYDEGLDPDRLKGEFFKGGEYGAYLDSFVNEFGLRKYIKLNTQVITIKREGDLWRVIYDDGEVREEVYTHVVMCTGLTESPKMLNTEMPTVKSLQEVNQITNKSVVVMGGGESAADLANRLADTQRNNKVYLSLKEGIRVSPRYHPIKGVPSDFLRNRLMLSISQNLRNKIGQKFVEARILYREFFEKLFPHKDKTNSTYLALKKEWDYKLTKSAKGHLFNMFHNKSDGFLDAVGEKRIEIIGSPVDGKLKQYHRFQSDDIKDVIPDLVIPMVGYQSNISRLLGESVRVSDFYLGCLHREYESLFLIGFARPIIGNIPSISEQQAYFVIKTIKGDVARPAEIEEWHHSERKMLKENFPKLNIDAIYPVEMFPYCDTLAKLVNTYPSYREIGSMRQWLNIQLSPASTIHYLQYEKIKTKVYTPVLLSILLFCIKIADKCCKK